MLIQVEHFLCINHFVVTGMWGRRIIYIKSMRMNYNAGNLGWPKEKTE